MRRGLRAREMNRGPTARGTYRRKKSLSRPATRGTLPASEFIKNFGNDREETLLVNRLPLIVVRLSWPIRGPSLKNRHQFQRLVLCNELIISSEIFIIKNSFKSIYLIVDLRSYQKKRNFIEYKFCEGYS